MATDIPGGDISDEASILLTDELRRVTGRDDVRAVPGERTSHATDAGRPHSPMTAALVEHRSVIGITFFMFLTVGAIVAFATGEWWTVVVALAVHAVATIAVAGGAFQMMSETEHVDPDTAARLEAEGIGDPDRLFTELVADVRARRRPASRAPRVA